MFNISEFTDKLLAAQAFIFFLAGFETSSTTLSFCLYELALNPGIQDKLREHIKAVTKTHGGQVTYDSLHDMPYLDQVVEGTIPWFIFIRVIYSSLFKHYIFYHSKDGGMYLEDSNALKN